MILLIQLYIVIWTLLLAGKDATSYQLKDKNTNFQDLERRRVQRWHRDGSLMFALVTLSSFVVGILLSLNWPLILAYSLLIRLAIFDYFFNKWAGLDVRYLGSTAIWDKIFISIFGKNGAIRKSLVFSLLIILLNLLFGLIL